MRIKFNLRRIFFNVIDKDEALGISLEVGIGYVIDVRTITQWD